jgi:hypothetical protein
MIYGCEIKLNYYLKDLHQRSDPSLQAAAEADQELS